MTLLNPTQYLEDAKGKTPFFCQLDDLSLIQYQGEDAASFLHNQLSNEVIKLKSCQAKRAAYCNAKGRMQASLFYFKWQDSIFVQCHQSLQPQLQKRLQMFIMRSKVTSLDVSENYVIYGLGFNEQTRDVFSELFDNFEHADKLSTPHEKYQGCEAIFQAQRLLLIPTSAYRCLVYLPRMVQESFEQSLIEKGISLQTSQTWRIEQLAMGIPQITQATYEKFVPQMINFELIDGVNFKKGCYPGQEIVARSQYLGKLKRRMYLCEIPSTLVQAGDELFSSYADSDNASTDPCGRVVNSELWKEGLTLALVEMKIADFETNEVHHHNAQGAKLSFYPLPYAFEDITQS